MPKLNQLFILLIFSAVLQSQAQNNSALVPMIKTTHVGELFGFKDKSGNTVIPAQYKRVIRFDRGLAKVMDVNNMWGVINKKGEPIIPIEYDAISERYTRVNYHSNVQEYYPNTFIVTRTVKGEGDKYKGYWNESVYKHMFGSNTNKTLRLQGLINEKGKIVIPLGPYSFNYEAEHILMQYHVEGEGGTVSAILNEQGDVIFGPVREARLKIFFDKIIANYPNCAKFSGERYNRNVCEIYNLEGKIVISASEGYGHISPVKDGFFSVSRDFPTNFLQ